MHVYKIRCPFLKCHVAVWSENICVASFVTGTQKSSPMNLYQRTIHIHSPGFSQETNVFSWRFNGWLLHVESCVGVWSGCGRWWGGSNFRPWGTRVFVWSMEPMVLDHFRTGQWTLPADLVNLRFIYSLPGVSVGVQVRKNKILTNNHGHFLGLGHGGAPTTLTTKRPLLGSTAKQKKRIWGFLCSVESPLPFLTSQHACVGTWFFLNSSNTSNLKWLQKPTLTTKLIQKRFALLLFHDWMLTVSAVLFKTMGWATLLSMNIVTVVDCLNININILSNHVCLVLGTISIIHYSKLIGGELIDK